MSEYAVMPLSDYTSACDAIRTKLGTHDDMTSGELATKINAIPTGSNGGAIEISTYAEMAEIMADENNDGKLYKYVGTTSGEFIHNGYYFAGYAVDGVFRILTNVSTGGFSMSPEKAFAKNGAALSFICTPDDGRYFTGFAATMNGHLVTDSACTHNPNGTITFAVPSVDGTIIFAATTAEGEMLDTPSMLKITGSTLSWNGVRDADEYIVFDGDTSVDTIRVTPKATVQSAPYFYEYAGETAAYVIHFLYQGKEIYRTRANVSAIYVQTDGTVYYRAYGSTNTYSVSLLSNTSGFYYSTSPDTLGTYYPKSTTYIDASIIGEKSYTNYVVYPSRVYGALKHLYITVNMPYTSLTPCCDIANGYLRIVPLPNTSYYTVQCENTEIARPSYSDEEIRVDLWSLGTVPEGTHPIKVVGFSGSGQRTQTCTKSYNKTDAIYTYDLSSAGLSVGTHEMSVIAHDTTIEHINSAAPLPVAYTV